MCTTSFHQNIRRVSRSGSVPNLASDSTSNASIQLNSVSAIRKTHRHRNHRTAGSVVHHNIGDCGNPLQADALHFQRQLLSMVDGSCQADEFVGAQSRIYDKAKRSDTAKRHVLSRQKPIQKDEHQTSGSVRYTSDHHSNVDILEIN